HHRRPPGRSLFCNVRAVRGALGRSSTVPPRPPLAQDRSRRRAPLLPAAARRHCRRRVLDRARQNREGHSNAVVGRDSSETHPTGGLMSHPSALSTIGRPLDRPKVVSIMLGAGLVATVLALAWPSPALACCCFGHPHAPLCFVAVCTGSDGWDFEPNPGAS